MRGGPNSVGDEDEAAMGLGMQLGFDGDIYSLVYPKLPAPLPLSFARLEVPTSFDSSGTLIDVVLLFDADGFNNFAMNFCCRCARNPR